MTFAAVIEDARSVWLYGTEPQCSVEQYDRATEAVIEELFAAGRRRGVLDDPRVRVLMNAKSKLGEVTR